MAIILLSVPNTGTRFTGGFLEFLGLNYRQYHSEPASYEDIQWESGKAVVPMRDPALQWVSTHFSNNLKGFDQTLKLCAAYWDLLGRIEKWTLLGKLEKQFNIAYLRLDADDFQGELKQVAKHCGIPLTKHYENKPVGNFLKDPIGYDLWDMYKTEEVENVLKPYRIKYGYLSANNG